MKNFHYSQTGSAGFYNDGSLVRIVEKVLQYGRIGATRDYEIQPFNGVVDMGFGRDLAHPYCPPPPWVETPEPLYLT